MQLLKLLVLSLAAFVISVNTLQINPQVKVQFPEPSFVSQPVGGSNYTTTAVKNSVIDEVSRNWSGYVATGGKFSAVRGTWTIPRLVNNGDYGADAAWVGIGGVSSEDLIQAGTESEIDNDGTVTYKAFYEMLPDFSRSLPVTVSGGDSVTISITKENDGSWLIYFKNNTTGQNYQTTVNYDSSVSSAEWVEEAPSGLRNVLPLDNFGTIQFEKAAAIKDGKTLNIAQVNANAVAMADSFGNILATSSSIGADGASFKVTRVNYDASQNQVIRPNRSEFPRRIYKQSY